MNRFTEFDLVKKPLRPIAGYWACPVVPLDQALASLSSKINELDRSIQEARRHCHFPSEHNLTRDESASIFLYTMEAGEYSFYRILNQVLRDEDRNKSQKWFSYLKLFDTALRKLPTTKGCIWRGVSGDLSKYYHEDDVFTWWNITSCTLSAKEAEKFLNPTQSSTLFMIEAVNGRDISGYTIFPDEKEIVLNVGTKFRVKSSALKHGKLNVVHLIEIDDNVQEEVPKAMAGLSLMSSPSNNNASKISDVLAQARWTHQGVTVAGGYGQGGATNQLSYPWGLDIIDDQTIAIADYSNHRILQWKKGDTNGTVVAGSNGPGGGMNQLTNPRHVLVDKKTDSLIIADCGNKRVVRWSRRKGTIQGEILIENITCVGLAMDSQRCLYVSDNSTHEVRRYDIERDDIEGTVVAGGNGGGAGLNQLAGPTFLFVDPEQNVYVSDSNNHRVMKWNKGAKEGIIVAGGKGSGNSLTQLSSPFGVYVDMLGNVYVTDYGNQRVMRWSQPMKRGAVIVGGNGSGNGPHQFAGPLGLCFDQLGDLYVVDQSNHRVQRFSIEK